MVNVLMSIALFIIYRMVIAELKPVDESWIEKLLYMLDILLNLGFSTMFLLVMLVGSLAIFLNQIKKIRNNYYLSLLTFLAIPLVSTVGLLIKLWIDFHTYDRSIIRTVAIFSTFYLLLNTATFLMFRKRMEKVRESEV